MAGQTGPDRAKANEAKTSRTVIVLKLVGLMFTVGLVLAPSLSAQSTRKVSYAAAKSERRRKTEPFRPVEQCGGLPACIFWHTNRQVQKMNMSVILVGNDAMQQFPLTGYGGIETTVEKIAWELYRMRIPFAAIGPKRKDPPPFPFPVYDTAVFSNGAWNSRNAFAGESASVVGKLYSDGGKSPFLLLGQSDWSQDIAIAPGVLLAVTSHHDGAGPPNRFWDRSHAHVVHRFLSEDQRSRWLIPADPRFNESRVIPHGLAADDFDAASTAKPGQEPVPTSICPDQGYFLWVANLDWGWEQKGMEIFVKLARRRPLLKFVAYGHATVRKDLIQRAHDIDKELPNFEFRGRLGRGKVHKDAFCGATAFLMPTQPDIGESFGMTVIESLSKGVPVIASTSAAVPELLGRPFGSERRGVTEVGSVCDTLDDYEAALEHWGSRSLELSRSIQQWTAKRYSIGTVVDALLQAGIDRGKDLGIFH